ncbi:MAG: bifunctional folylpolyglutamate synthase/dihydrofolate synthase [Proteiniphilum sp.]|nr:bifunctional folylpolyglutamate synthase/dihydrofolate synthase [Proteiniphilum sp.]
MNYDETLNYLYNQMPEFQRIGHLAYKPGLDNSYKLDAIFERPHTRYKTIHVGGTNGKGSTSHLITSILIQSGYKVGLYTSPHLIDFRERIRVNGEMVSKEYVIEFVEKYRAQFEPVMPSFFELTMEMAFKYFEEQEVDVAVIEVGLGGRLDSTNIISPEMCVITNIGFDHVQFLGNSLEAIAREKAGIIKPHTPVVIGEASDQNIRNVFVNKAGQEEAPIIFAEEEIIDFVSKRDEDCLHFSGGGFNNIKSQLNGLAQEKNARTVITAIKELKKIGYSITDDAVYTGFENVVRLTGLMGRWQQLSDKPRIICDTGHNSHGIKYIVEQLRNEQYDNLHIVFGMVNDKDVSSVLELVPKDAKYYFTRASIERALTPEEIAKKALVYGLRGDTYDNIKQAIDAAKQNADENDLIFIGGSSFIVADALPYFV